MVRNCDEMNVAAIMSVLGQGYLAQMKKRDNLRLMKTLALKGVSVLARERNGLED
jgi:hypothetical protein